LTDITSNAFPNAESAIENLMERLDAKQDLAAAADNAVEAAVILTDKMEKVLSAMVNLQSFHEAIELLRSVLSLQEKVENETKQLRKKKIEEMLK
jgi:hypothetical protein